MSAPRLSVQPDAKRAFLDLVRLAGEIGVRVAGTPAEHAGAEHLAKQFLQSGLEPRSERFPIPVWREQRASLRVGNRDIPAISPCFGGQTGSTGVTSEVVPVGDPLTEQDLGDIDVSGKIALVEGRNVYWDYPDYPQTDLLLANGAIGAIFAAGKVQAGGLPQAYYNFKRALHEATPPSVIVSYADAQSLAREQGTATITVEADVTWSESINVLADLPGSERQNEIVLVSAHHDSTWTSPGASDNAGGCAVVAELARIATAGPAPRRTIRFAHWGGHEVGLFGSESWLHQHLDDVGNIVAVINFDGQGVLQGANTASLLGSASWQRLATSALDGTGVEVDTRVGGGGVDSVNFAALGRNAVNFSRWGTIGNHTPADNLDPLGPAGLEPGLRLSAAVLSAVANGDDFDAGEATPFDQLRETHAWCARWGWGITG